MLIQERDETIIRLLSLPSDTERDTVQADVAPDDGEQEGSLFNQLIEDASTMLGARFLKARVPTGNE